MMNDDDGGGRPARERMIGLKHDMENRYDQCEDWKFFVAPDVEWELTHDDVVKYPSARDGLMEIGGVRVQADHGLNDGVIRYLPSDPGELPMQERLFEPGEVPSDLLSSLAGTRMARATKITEERGRHKRFPMDYEVLSETVEYDEDVLDKHEISRPTTPRPKSVGYEPGMKVEELMVTISLGPQQHGMAINSSDIVDLWCERANGTESYPIHADIEVFVESDREESALIEEPSEDDPEATQAKFETETKKIKVGRRKLELGRLFVGVG